MRFFSSAEADRVSVFVVLVEEIVEAVVVVVVVLAGRPRGDFFCGDGGDCLDSLSFSVFCVACFLAGLFGTAFDSFLLADFGLPRARPFGDTLSSTMGEGLRFRPGDFRVPRRVLTS